MNQLTLLGLALAIHAPAHAFCWEQAGLRYGVSPDVLRAVAGVESNLNPRAVNRSHVARTGSYDIGLMQINSSHLPALKQHGITHATLLSDPCTNVHVGAWLLSQTMRRHGQTWNAIGAYNAACRQLKGDQCTEARAAYAWRVYRRLHGHGGGRTPAQQASPTLTLVRVSATQQ